MIQKLRESLVPIIFTGILSAVSTFAVTVNEVSANSEQGKKNETEIKKVSESLGAVRERQSAMDAKLDLLVERDRRGR